MNSIIKYINEQFKNTPDLIIKKIDISLFKTIYIVYLETVSSSDKINDYILKNLSTISASKNKKTIDINSILPSPNTVEVKNKDEIEYFITNGFTIVIKNNKILAIETKADINRSIAPSDTEPATNGPKDAFNENYQINLGLIKRRIKSHTLKTEEFTVGRKTLTKIGVIYFDDIAQMDSVNTIKDKIKKIDIDGIIDSTAIADLICDEGLTQFPTFMISERPDNVVRSLLEGKIAILVDTSPFVIILPAFFADFINPIVDTYHKSKNVNFIKLLRFACFFMSLFAPGVYIALINYNQETIPTNLLINFSNQRAGVPFPAAIEAIIMLFICEILRESDIRFPNSYGSAISILGALILGDAAISAGVVSPIMIIVIALTFISSLIFTDVEISNTIRHFRFIILLFSAFFGILGLVYGILYFLIIINDVTSLNKPYFYPLMPFDKTYLFKTILKKPIKDETKRSSLLAKKNKIKQKDKSIKKDGGRSCES